MKVIVLAAGYATRLYPLTESRPKALLPVGGRPILEHIFDRLNPLSTVSGVSIVTNHKFAGAFEEWAKRIRKYPWPVSVVNDGTMSNETRLGAVGDLAYALKVQKIRDEDLLVAAGDNLFDFDLGVFERFAVRKSPYLSIAAFDVRDKILARQYGLLRLGEEGRVVEFLEKPENPPTTLASCGLYWIPREGRVFLDRYLAGGHNADQPGHWMRWLAQNNSLYGITLSGSWFDIGDLDSYRKADATYRV